MPGLESRSAATKINLWTKIQPVMGRFDYNQKLGNLKELLQKGGYRDFSRKVIPLPRLAANPTLNKALYLKMRRPVLAQKYHSSAYCHQLL
jgi:hypothetical protein